MIIKKRKFGKSSQSIFFTFFLIFIILAAISFLAFSNWQINKKRTELNKTMENLKAEIGLLERQKEEFSQKISQTQRESFLEKEARERFNLKKPGEEAVVILAPEEKKEEVKEQKTFWQKILEKIGF